MPTCPMCATLMSYPPPHSLNHHLQIEREPTCVTHHLRNMCCVMRVLQVPITPSHLFGAHRMLCNAALQTDVLNTDLSYIEPSAIFAGDVHNRTRALSPECCIYLSAQLACCTQ